MNVKHLFAPYGSDIHAQTIALRQKVLRTPLGMRFTEAQLKAEKNQLHIAQYNGQIITACLVMKPICETIVKMRQVAVDPSLQGKGLGRQLVVFTENEMFNRGFQRIELHAREMAVGFYEQLEYSLEGDKFDEIGIPHYKMIKNIF